MFGFLEDLYNSVFGNSGSSAAKDLAAAGVKSTVDDIKSATTARAGGNPAAGSAAASGYNPSASGGGGTQAGVTDPDMVRVTTQSKDLKTVGTNINDPKNGVQPDTIFKGFPSLFNPYYLVRYHTHMKTTSDAETATKYITDLNTPEGNIEYKGLADGPEYKNPSTALIVNRFANNEKSPEKKYSYSDFLYLKHYHPFNNNRLITLRRFMAPVYDELRIAIKDADTKIRKPIAQALSYLDSSQNKFSTLAKFDVEIKTKTTNGALDNVTTLREAEETFSLGKGSTTLTQSYNKLLGYLAGTNAGDDGGSVFKNWTSTYDPWTNGPLQDLVYGPVNVITGSLIRDRGLTFKQDGLKVNFEYSSKTIENVNQKAAMLDILSNMLALTYNHALFWGGENRFLIERKNFPLAKAEVMFSILNNLNDPKEVFRSIGEQIGLGTSNLITNFGDLIESAINGIKIDEKPQEGQMEAEKENAKNKLTLAASALALGDSKTLKQLQRQILEGTKAELTGAPTGEWHLQVGNPFAPIMMIGNLWCTGANFEFNDDLSIDDFPTELKVSCTLKHGRTRDASDIQSIFNGGGGRIYYPYANADVDVNASYSTNNSESANTIKSNEVKNYDGRVNKDNAGNKIADAVKVNDKGKSKIEANLFKPIKTKF